eukprot:322649-Amphidinium_carterae.1
MDLDPLQYQWGKGKGSGKENGGTGKDKGHGKDKGGKGKDKGKPRGGKGEHKDGKIEGYCGLCGKWGHAKRVCWQNQKGGKPGGKVAALTEEQQQPSQHDAAGAGRSDHAGSGSLGL